MGPREVKRLRKDAGTGRNEAVAQRAQHLRLPPRSNTAVPRQMDFAGVRMMHRGYDVRTRKEEAREMNGAS